MSSESDVSDEIPSDSILEQSLRDVLTKAHKAGKLDSVTVNSVRQDAEKSLGLATGFFKSDDKWKSKSKEVIHAALDEAQEQETSNSPPRKNDKPVKPSPKSTKPQTKKRASAAPIDRSRKRQKSSSDEESDVVTSAGTSSESDEEDAPSVKSAAKPSKPRKSKNVILDDEEDEEQDMSKNEETSTQAADQPTSGALADRSESELSDVLDEPVPKRKKKSVDKGDPKPKTKGGKASKPSAPKAKDLTPDEEEIKRLQSWLLKCGIRKLWHRELAPYDSAKAKIKHLKDMLKDAGMDGRFSAEKAAAIKERRELAADLEAVQEGAKKWGQDKDDDEDASERPAKRRAVATRFVDFGDEDDEDD